jgi:hypothetical protein
MAHLGIILGSIAGKAFAADSLGFREFVNISWP